MRKKRVGGNVIACVAGRNILSVECNMQIAEMGTFCQCSMQIAEMGTFCQCNMQIAEMGTFSQNWTFECDEWIAAIISRCSSQETKQKLLHMQQLHT
jgi:hypothetical protein